MNDVAPGCPADHAGPMHCLHTERLVLEPQRASHAPEMFRVLSDPALYAFEGAAPTSVDWLAARFARLEAGRSPDGREAWLNWVVRLRSSGALAGYVQATVYQGGAADVAYVMASRHWGQGLATEAVCAMLRALRQTHPGMRFAAVLKQDNERSRRLLERLGFVRAPDGSAAQRRLEPGEILMVDPEAA